MKSQNGKYYWTYMTLQGIQSDLAHPNNIMIFKKNVDVVKRKEEQNKQELTDALNTAKAASEAKGAFMSRMSHEIRTPLNAVIGYMTIAKNNNNNLEKIKDCINKAEIAAKHLLSIINDVLDMSSIESGKLKVAKSSFDIRELVSNASAVFYMQSMTRNVKFETITKGIENDFLIGDKLRVNQILLNLLSNAVKFTSEGGEVFFTVEQTGINNNTVFIKFTVSDTGIGMTKEFRDRLFMPFEQQDSSIAQNFGGTGIGLSITKNLVTMMNGKIKVESELGKGSTFSVELPFAIDRSTERNIDEHDFSYVHALIVDDEQSACEYMHILMRRCGVNSEYALSGKSAINSIINAAKTGHPFDLCLMDWKMPDMNGVETVKRIREQVGNDLPIIIVTAYDFSEIEESAKASGVSLFISKPLFQSTMFDLLVSIYGNYKISKSEQSDKLYDFSGKRLLLAEDNEMNREIATDILSMYNFKLDATVNGKEALDAFIASPQGTYDAILMDIQMPLMDGYEATKAIRASNHPESKTIPIIAMTANAFS
ncbi:MAG: response regulator, partial [Clostridia bacterium]